MIESYDCIIIGSGIAGHSAAEAFRMHDQTSSLAMITQEDVPLYSPCVLPYYISGEMPKDKIFLDNPVDHTKLRMDWIGGTEVTGINVDNGTISLKGTPCHHIHYDRLILATGSIPTMPPSLKLDLTGLFTFKWFSDAEKILNYPARTAVVVGSGLIGLEVAVALANRAMKVTLVAAMPHIMPMLLDAEPALRVQETLNLRNVHVLTNERVETIMGKGRVRGVATSNREISADMVIVAKGLAPDVVLAREAGIEIGSARGISVTSEMQTSIENIYACGDCVESQDFLFREPSLNLFWHIAKIQGTVAGANAARKPKLFSPYPRIASTEVFKTPIYSIGFTEEELLRRDKKPECVLSEDKKGLIKIVILDDRICGIQLINRTRDLAYLVPVLHMRLSLAELNALDKEKVKTIPHLLRYTHFRPFTKIASS